MVGHPHRAEDRDDDKSAPRSKPSYSRVHAGALDPPAYRDVLVQCDEGREAIVPRGIRKVLRRGATGKRYRICQYICVFLAHPGHE